MYSDSHLRVISQELHLNHELQKSNFKVTYLSFHLNLPGVNNVMPKITLYLIATDCQQLRSFIMEIRKYS